MSSLNTELIPESLALLEVIAATASTAGIAITYVLVAIGWYGQCPDHQLLRLSSHKLTG